MQTDKTDSLWPYLLFLPDDLERRDEFIRSVLASRLARSVLSSFDDTGKVLQRDLIENLPHSNKSILAYLKTLGEFGLITTGTTVHNGKRVVIHELTKNGWGLARFFFEGLPADVEELTSYLLEDYLVRLSTIYRDQGLPESNLFRIFARTRAKAILEGSKVYHSPDFVLFGASTFYTQVECAKLPPVGGLSSCDYPVRKSGGPTVELAHALASEGLETTLVSSVGNDLDGWDIITQLIQSDVDVRHIVVDAEKQTNNSIIINEPKGSRTLVGISKNTSLSITSPTQVPWDVLEKTKSIYIGEVFLEVASSLVGNAKAHGIPVLYRCSIPYWDMGLNKLRPLLSQVDTLLISNRAWVHIRKSITPRTIQRIQSATDANIIIRETSEKYRMIENGETTYLDSKSTKDDITEWFVAGLLQKMAERLSFLKTIKFAIRYEQDRLVA